MKADFKIYQDSNVLLTASGTPPENIEEIVMDIIKNT